MIELLWIWVAYLGLCTALYIPLIFIRMMEIRSGDPLWLGHKLFGKDCER